MELWGHSQLWRQLVPEQIWKARMGMNTFVDMGFLWGNRKPTLKKPFESFPRLQADAGALGVGGVRQPSPSFRILTESKGKAPSLLYLLPYAVAMCLVFISLPQILGLCFTNRFSSLQRICSSGLASLTVLLQRSEYSLLGCKEVQWGETQIVLWSDWPSGCS